jgi:hypothetical protein
MGTLTVLNDWAGKASGFFARRGAQSYFAGAQLAMATGSACGAGGGEKGKPKPSACGSACGAGGEKKKPEPTPSACGSSCGAGGEKKKPEPKPSACGAGGR